MIRIKFRRVVTPPDPPEGRRASWRVMERTWGCLLVRHLGYVNTRSRADALDRARQKYPEARKIIVNPKSPD